MTDAAPDPDESLRQALRGVAVPLARLCIARGMRFGAVEELLKQAFVQAAREAHPDVAGHRDVSRVSTATGLNRREVTRLTQDVPAAAATRRSPATELFTRWAADRKLRDRKGHPRALPRHGPAPSFESLAHSVTRDVHPRSLLEELVRLGLVTVDEAGDTVTLVRDAFVPRGDEARMFGFLGSNVGDHLGAAVANVLGDGQRHFEQAIFADGLSDDSIQSLRPLIGTQWQALMAALVPQIEALIAADAQAGRDGGQRLRIGLYSFNEAAARPAVDDPET